MTLLFPAGLEGELNRFFIEPVDADANHGKFYFRAALAASGYDRCVRFAGGRLEPASRRAAMALAEPKHLP